VIHKRGVHNNKTTSTYFSCSSIMITDFDCVLPHMASNLSTLLTPKTFSTLALLNKQTRTHIFKNARSFERWMMISIFLHNTPIHRLQVTKIPFHIQCKLIPFLFTKNSLELHYCSTSKILFLSYESFFFTHPNHTINLSDLFHPQQEGLIDFYNLDFHNLPRCQSVISVSDSVLLLSYRECHSRMRMLDTASHTVSDVLVLVCP
jgi:hypothetical protein